VRSFVSDMSNPIALPSRAGDKPGDDPAVRARMARLVERHAVAIVDAVTELGELGLVEKAEATVGGARVGPAVQGVPAQQPRVVLRVLPGR